MKAIITSPVKDYMGISASVAFADGKAEADISESQLEYFKSADYKVKILDAKTGDKTKKDAKTGDKTKKDAKTGDKADGETE